MLDSLCIKVIYDAWSSILAQRHIVAGVRAKRAKATSTKRK